MSLTLSHTHKKLHHPLLPSDFMGINIFSSIWYVQGENKDSATYGNVTRVTHKWKQSAVCKSCA